MKKTYKEIKRNNNIQRFKAWDLNPKLSKDQPKDAKIIITSGKVKS